MLYMSRYIYWVEDSVMYITIYLTSRFLTLKLDPNISTTWILHKYMKSSSIVGHCKIWGRQKKTIIALFVKETHDFWKEIKMTKYFNEI